MRKTAIDELLQYALQQYRASSSELDPSNGYPRNTDQDGRWTTTAPSGWTSGFYPGVLWYLYEYSGEDALFEQAKRWTAGLTEQQHNTNTHDVGFMILNSFGHAYRLTGDEQYRPVILNAARSLTMRYNDKVGATQSWSWTPPPPKWQWLFPVIIDNMMNLELLFWAAKNGGEARWYDVAARHALTSAKYHMREDGSTYHVVDFDPETGAFRKGLTHQGHADESAWARGQAWAVYGFTMVYRETGDARFIDVAQKLADFFIDNLPDDDVPYWDFRAPNIPDEERDASAGAIAASGLLELSTLVSDEQVSARYFGTATKILTELGSPSYLAKGSHSQALLLHSVGSKPGGSEIDVPIIYGEYYFVEALLRYRAMMMA